MSPRTPHQFQEIREEKITLIMDVALEHFANEGYFRTSISHISKHAGISKGLMYNYFESKEALLKAIVHRSVNEIYKYLDINRDGYLSEEEFEYFIRRIYVLLKEKRSFWRLLFQLLMQKEVREEVFRSFIGTDSLLDSGNLPEPGLPVSRIMKIITDYFVRKKQAKGENYDSVEELNLFLIMLKGFAITNIYANEGDEEYAEKVINRIIELFK